VRIGREKKRRGGKTVTVISGLPLDNPSLPELAAEIKKTFGCGGSVKDGNILIQGDKRELLLKLLKQKGFVVKVIGA
jgi:translation initiation factor 1